MKCLIVEDDFTARKLLQMYLSDYGDCSIAVNGNEALDAVRRALDEGQPYDLICLDIMMPEMSGQEALKAIRQLEEERGIYGLDSTKIIMTTALSDSGNVKIAFKTGCESYIAKPVKKERLVREMAKLGLVKLELSK
jgi:two-component system chemotaxis response regulator CheY